MSFTPFARYRNFTLANLKALLEVYPDMARSIPWEEAKDFAEANLKGYKRTAYQQACQLGLEDRTKDSFRIHNYLYTFDDENLKKYLVFWFKTYFAPNPHVKSSDEAFLLYCRLCEDILQSESHSVNFEDFVEKNIGGKSDDILLNAIKAYAAPVKYRKVGNYDNLYISESDINAIEDEVSFIKANFPIGNPKSEHNFFERFSYANFCKFYGKDENPEVKDGEEIRLADTSRVELHFEQSKECARQLVDCVYRIDNFERFSKVLKNNDKNVKIITDDLGGNYLRYMFAKSTSDLYENTSGGKKRVFLDKDYEINVDGMTEKCRLSTEWVSSELGDGTASANYLQALMKTINTYYSDVLKIYEEFGRWYLEYLKQDFKLSDLPECFKSRFAQRYIQSLLAKPFVILTGNSGTGKTRISKQFAEYLEVDFGNDEKNWLLIPVGADWTDNTKILGFYNPLAIDGKGEYEKTAILKLIERANLPENKSVPFFIILDEMNLSYVERYFADFLSHMETPDLKFVLDGYPGVLRYPENLFVVGTVNIDETTYMFSPKVLDRANVIEFKPEENSVLDLFVNPADNENINPASDGTAEAFEKMAVLIRAGKSNLEVDILVEIQSVFKRIYEIVEKSGYEFAYRTVREIRQYLSAVYELTEDKETFDFYSIIDEQLIQKILPKIHGNNKEIGGLLEELGALCVEYNLPLSREKIEKMKGKLAQIQYASFI